MLNFGISGTPAMQICHKLLRHVVTVTLLLVFLRLPLSGEDRKSNREHAEASLHITAFIVPSAMLLPRSPRPTESAVSYDIPHTQLPLNVTERVRPFTTSAVLKTVTVVPQ